MKLPTKAIVLCAGMGTRMSPLTNVIPKPLLPVWGKPLLDHTVERLHTWGVTDVLINVHHRADRICEHIYKHPNLNVRVNISHEPEILGTGGAISHASWFIGEEPFWIVNGDIAFDTSPRPILKRFNMKKQIAALWVTDKAGPRTVDVADGVVTNFQSDEPGGNGTYTFCGLHLASPEIVNYIPDKGFSSIIEAYKLAISDGHAVVGVNITKSFWADAGTPSTYIDVHREIKKRYKLKLPGQAMYDIAIEKRNRALRKAGVQIEGFASVSPSAVVYQGATIHDSVILPDSILKKGANVNCAIISNSTIHGSVSRIGLPLDSLSDDNLTSAVAMIGWNTSKTVAMPMQPRGSARRFTRLEYAKRKAISVEYSLERPENALYVDNARFLDVIGIRVPKVLLDRPDDNISIIEDLGDLSLNILSRSKSDKVIFKHYCRVLDSVCKLHRTDPILLKKLTLAPPFDRKLYKWEHDLFKDNFLIRMLSLEADLIAPIMKELADVASSLNCDDKVLLHRDLQSTNILMVKGTQPAFIDFQGMRIGPYSYDLASLICDPYISLKRRIRDDLVKYYSQISGREHRDVIKSLDYASIQRLVQAIGAYARLGSNRETRGFLTHIKPAILMLNNCINPLNKFSHLKELCAKVYQNLQ